jgi:ubiquinone/menaquinone biosynthesis C-methylase UbiE
MVHNSAYEPELLRIQEVYRRRAANVPHHRYSLLNPGTLCIYQERQRRTLELFRRRGLALERARVLEVGCGDGFELRELINWGARPENLYGVDLLSDRIAEAKLLCPPAVTVVCGSAHELEFESQSFDFVLQLTVFTSILDASMQKRIASEMLRVLKPSGFVLWYDFHTSNPWNPDVKGISRRQIQELFPGCTLRLDRMVVVPPLARTVGRLPLLYLILSASKLLCTHYLGTIEKPGDCPHD